MFVQKKRCDLHRQGQEARPAVTKKKMTKKKTSKTGEPSQAVGYALWIRVAALLAL